MASSPTPSWVNTPSGTMKAASLTKPNASPPSACFTYTTDYPKPTVPGPEWVLVRVRAAGLNRAELRARMGHPISRLEFGIFESEFVAGLPAPKILGEEYVGEVEEAGGESGFKKGDLVAGWAYGGGKPYDGAYAEYTLSHRRRTWRLPEAARGADWATLGAVPMGLWTAYGGIFVAGEAKEGDVVLVHGATSSVGVWAILACKDRGCKVIATTRNKDKIARLKAVGADLVVTEEELTADPASVLKTFPDGVNVVLELIGMDTLGKIWPIMKMHGTIVLCGLLDDCWSMQFSPDMIRPTVKMTCYTTLESDLPESQRQLNYWAEKIAAGKVDKGLFLDKVFDVSEIGEAHQYMEENRAVGKVVVVIP